MNYVRYQRNDLFKELIKFSFVTETVEKKSFNWNYGTITVVIP